jgi:signal peptidase
VFLRDVVSSVGTVVLIGLVLFAVSGLWPPLVAVESGSMEPHMYKGDLVFVMDEQRFPPDQAAANTGVVTYRGAMQVDANDDSKRGYRSFGEYGNVVVYERDGTDGKPIIHRAMLVVEEGEEWVDRANQSHLGGATTCEEVYSCPAPYDGFITKGDANQYYDQSNRMRLSGVVKPEWIKGRAKARVPWLGHVRLLFGAAGASGTGGDAVASTTHGPVGHPAPASSVALAAAGQSSTGNGGVSSPAVGAVDASWNELPIPNHAIAVGATGLAFATRRLRRRTAA